MRRNQYEEALFRCEDDRFEVDVILETTRSAIAQLHLLRSELEAAQAAQKGAFRLRDDALSAVQLAAIRRVYAHNGMDQEVVKLLFLNPRDCIPRILERLEAKEKEWMGEKVLMNEVAQRGGVKRSAAARSRSRTTTCRWTTGASTSDRPTRRRSPRRSSSTPSRTSPPSRPQSRARRGASTRGSRSCASRSPTAWSTSRCCACCSSRGRASSRAARWCARAGPLTSSDASARCCRTWWSPSSA